MVLLSLIVPKVYCSAGIDNGRNIRATAAENVTIKEQGEATNGTDGDCPDCMSVDLVLFLLFLGAVTLGMLLSGAILWVIMRVSRKK